MQSSWIVHQLGGTKLAHAGAIGQEKEASARVLRLAGSPGTGY